MGRIKLSLPDAGNCRDVGSSHFCVHRHRTGCKACILQSADATPSQWKKCLFMGFNSGANVFFDRGSYGGRSVHCRNC